MGVEYNPSIVTNGLKVYLDGANPKSYPGSGTTWSDISGNLQDGVMTSTTFGSNAMTFDGTNSYVTCPNQNYITYTGTYTFSVWLNTTNGGVVFQNSGSSGNVTTDRNGLQLSTTAAVFGYYDGVSWKGVKATITTNRWYNIVCVNNATTLTVYSNGIPSTTPDVLYVHTIAGLHIGRQTIDATLRFNGSMAAIQAYNRALTQAEIIQNFNAHRGRFGV